MPELIATLGLAGLIGLGIYWAVMLVSKEKEFSSPALEYSGADLNQENSKYDADFIYNVKFDQFIKLCYLLKGGKITVPSWQELGDTEAERARNLLLVRDNNIILTIEATGEVLNPNTVSMPAAKTEEAEKASL